jgi:predicted permease
MGTLVNRAGPGYLGSVGMPLLNGRDILERDRPESPRVAIVNDTLARKYFNGESPIGRHISLQTGKNELDAEIVGVVKDFKHGDIRDNKQSFVFLPYLQFPRAMGMTFYVRTDRDPASMGETLARVVREVDPNLPVYDLKTLDRQASESLFVDRAIAMLASAFGLLATLLAAVGLYGVMAYSVTRRTREIGIRVALGASAGNVRRMVLGQVMWLVAAGIAIAIPIALVLSRFVKSQLFGLTGNDPLTIAVAAAAIAGISALAGFIPANRAVRIDPTVALRYE